MKRMLVTYTATVAINLPDGVEPTAKILASFTPDAVKDIKVKDSHDVVARDYAVYYHPDLHELLQLTYYDCSQDDDTTVINGNHLNYQNSIIPDLYKVVDKGEQELAAQGKLSVINPEYLGDMTTAYGLALAGNLTQWVGFDGKLPPISSIDALKGVCEMNGLDDKGWILLAQGDPTCDNDYNIYAADGDDGEE